jgi:hypothetical protein
MLLGGARGSILLWTLHVHSPKICTELPKILNKTQLLQAAGGNQHLAWRMNRSRIYFLEQADHADLCVEQAKQS